MPDIEDVIREWRLLSVIDRQHVIEQITALHESAELEDEIATSSLDMTQNGHSNTTSHIVVPCDFLKLTKSAMLHMQQKNEAVKFPNLIFTSPPYNADINYDSYNDQLSVDEYVDFLSRSLRVMNKLLLPGGRIVLNLRDISIATGSRLPIIVPLYETLCKELNYAFRGVHIWYKGREESSFAWGSYCRSSNPAIIDLFEYIFVFQKDGERISGIDSLRKTEFIESILGIWKIRPVKKTFGSRSGKVKNIIQHPCPFPLELVKRVINLYSCVGDWMLDPFAGVMTTAIAAANCGRNSVCVELSENYCRLGYNRFCDYHKDLLLTNRTNINYWN